MGLMIEAGLIIVGVGALLTFLASLRVGRGQFAGSGADVGRALVRALRVGTLLLVLYVVALWASGSLNGGIAGKMVSPGFSMPRTTHVTRAR
jgi:hypothetical protein